MCEDQYLKTLQRGVYKTTSKDGTPDEASWICRRCETAAQTPIITGLPGLPKTIVKQCYCKDNFEGRMYYPVQEFGAGWCQAKRRNRLALKNVYLSPLGYELHSKEDALTHQEFERAVHDNLLLSRESEYKEYREHVAAERKPKGRQAKGSRHKRPVLTPEKRTSGRATNSSYASSSVPDALPTAPPSVHVAAPVPVVAVDEEGILSTGKLCDFKTPPGCRIVWYTALSHGEKAHCKSESNTAVGTITTAGGSGNAADESINDSVISLSDASHINAAVLPSKVHGKGVLPITHHNLPMSGFFGLDEEDIRAYLEALPGSELCLKYIYSAAVEVRDALIAECRADSYRLVEKKSIDQRLVSLLLKERSHWHNHKSETYAAMRLPYSGQGLREKERESEKEREAAKVSESNETAMTVSDDVLIAVATAAAMSY
jgi:hypothetical protein